MRIVSLVPSFTELLFDLEMDSDIIGITRFCIHPSSKVKNVTKIGGTKNIKIQKIIELKPDLVIANKEENSKDDIIELSKECPVWVTEIYNLKDTIDMIVALGKKTNSITKANQLVSEISMEFDTLRRTKPTKEKRVAYVIWNNPIMLAGKGTFINEMLKELNWVNIVQHSGSRYPETTLNELNEMAPEILILSSEPFPFTQKHISEFEKYLPSTKVILADGEMFSWYGSHLKKAPSYFSQLLMEHE